MGRSVSLKTALAGISPVTFFGSAIIAVGLILYASVAPQHAATVFEQANAWIIAEAG